MSHAGFLPLLVAAFAAFLAGAINSVAGGGTLVSFPALVWLGLPPIVANATSTLGIWPGSLGSVWGFRRELGRADRTLRLLAVPAAVGGGLGALLLRSTSPALFERLVPFLLLFATLLFTLRNRVQRWLGTHAARERGRGWLVAAALCLLAVAVYGGYFGAGMSIVMLSLLGMLGMSDILEMNALTSLFSLCVNGVAIAVFIAAGLVQWHFVAAMAVGALAGGYGAAGLARRVGKTVVQRFVVVVGFGMTAALFVRVWGR